ncbi:unnamed protein product, partial [Rodentolepis nana]|uniref:Vomeronasal type-2 receptor n=1 Tax=Rodentolepis nana TaxID=102285 RepID=A0A0R3TCF9_RODNA
DFNTYAYYRTHVYLNNSNSTSVFNFIQRFITNEGKTHTALLNSHRVAVKITLEFSFMFYGYPTHEISLATGGFLYMGNIHHNHLTYSQYIAPLMADFDVSKQPGISMIKYVTNPNVFISQWNNVILKHCSKSESTFAFIYRWIIQLGKEPSSQKDVVVGISDAYLYNFKGKGIHFKNFIFFANAGIYCLV